MNSKTQLNTTRHWLLEIKLSYQITQSSRGNACEDRRAVGLSQAVSSG